MNRLQSVKQALADVFATVEGVNAAYPIEQPRSDAMPIVTVMTAGHQARALERPTGRSGLTDPLGGRIRVWSFRVRLWVSAKNSAELAQDQLDTILPLMLTALDLNPSLSGVIEAGMELEDCTLESSAVGVMNDQAGAPLLIADCDCSASWTEPIP